ncbi:GAF and ANTAR domain-containing protein [Nocardia takedensis]|uniref:GAF and ANTAR domain-containing protein n=1 Tax=Nocardia takedensis TaxID=259390 RepID=UPI0012F6E44D|nr:GAF and ANTAR domain-containing protein [Nocardia takedensis]
MDVAQFELVTERVRSALRLGGGDLVAATVTCVQALPVEHVAILIDEPHLGAQPWACSDEWTAGVEAALSTAGEGPAFEAVAGGEVVVLTEPARDADRWPTAATVLRGLPGAMVSVPLTAGPTRLGALNLYLAPERWSPALAEVVGEVSELIAAHLLSSNAAPPPTSTLIHRAAGALIAEHGLDTADAYARLRREAADRGSTLADYAGHLVGRGFRAESADR